MSPKQVLFVLAALSSGTVALSACSTTTSSTPATSPASTSASASTISSTSTPNELCAAIERARKVRPAPNQSIDQTEGQYQAYSQAWQEAASLAVSTPQLAEGLKKLAAISAKPTANSAADTKEALQATATIAPIIQSECGINVFN